MFTEFFPTCMKFCTILHLLIIDQPISLSLLQAENRPLQNVALINVFCFSLSQFVSLKLEITFYPESIISPCKTHCHDCSQLKQGQSNQPPVTKSCSGFSMWAQKRSLMFCQKEWIPLWFNSFFFHKVLRFDRSNVYKVIVLLFDY